MKMSCIVIEDEPLAIEKLERFIEKTETLRLLGSFENSIQGLQFLQENSVDVVFLDIQMEGLDGIQLLESLTTQHYVIITSAHSEYAIKGFELDVFDYLLKPIEFKRFLKTIHRLIDQVRYRKFPVISPKTHIWVKSEGRLENICIRDIQYVEGMREYLQIVLPNRKLMVKQSFAKLLNELPEGQFAQVHKSWVVQLSKIVSIEQNRIRMSSISIPIGNTYKNQFMALISAEERRTELRGKSNE